MLFIITMKKNFSPHSECKFHVSKQENFYLRNVFIVDAVRSNSDCFIVLKTPCFPTRPRFPPAGAKLLPSCWPQGSSGTWTSFAA